MSMFIWNNIPSSQHGHDQFRRLLVFLGGALLGTVLLSSKVVWGQDITWSGGTVSSTDNNNNPKEWFTGNAAMSSKPGSLFPKNSASGNTVTVTGGTIAGNIYGGIATPLGSRQTGYHAIGNTVSIMGGDINGSGNVPGDDRPTGGTTGGTIQGNIYGGFSAYGNAIGNTVKIGGGGVGTARVNGIVFGGYTLGGTATDTIPGVNALNNIVIVGSGADLRYNVYGAFNNGKDGSRTEGNQVIFNGGEVSGSKAEIITGGYSLVGAIRNNSVTINGGNIQLINGSIYGGRLNGMVAGDAVTNNTVTITGGYVNVNGIYGGQVANATGHASADNNNVIITGGTINSEEIYGGFTRNNTATAGTTNNNTVTLSGSPLFENVTSLGGGNRTNSTGNTLNVWNYTHKEGSSIGHLGEFQYYDFRLPASLDGALREVGNTNFTNAFIKGVNIMGGGSIPKAGGSLIPLIVGNRYADLQTSEIQPDPSIKNADGTINGKKGATLDIVFELLKKHEGTAPSGYEDLLENELDGVYLYTLGVKAAPEAKAPSEGSLAGVALLNQGADLVARQGISEAVRTACDAEKFTLKPCQGFMVVSGGKSRYNTGSHVDVAGVVLITGVAWGGRLDTGRLTLGTFIEYGNGSYDTYNSFSHSASVRGDGNIWHLGTGVLGRMDFTNNAYAEGSFRIGGIHNKNSIANLQAAGTKTSYDSSSIYSSAHLGAGYILKINEKNDFDLYGKYFWTRQGSDSVTLSSADRVNFKAVNSHRVRAGGRYDYSFDKASVLYAGVAYEYEFDNKAKATTYGYDIDAPGLKGSTGVMELGVSFKPSPSVPLFFDVGIQGYVGKREGVMGSIYARYDF